MYKSDKEFKRAIAKKEREELYQLNRQYDKFVDNQNDRRYRLI